ncbi:MAG: hypothetical protein LBE83_02250 [Propionibacteriaceae bacterium]|jgi:hypothetical protein|nr:hypothetical protein [Propionibacteriaceae bacterium]
MKYKLFGAVLGLVVLLAGCSSIPSGEPTATDPIQPTSIDTQTTDPTGPGDPTYEGWLISSAGIGPYELNAPYDPAPGQGTWRCSLRIYPNETYGTVSLYDTDVAQWDANESTPNLKATLVMTSWSGTETTYPARTAEGIGPGSTRDEVEAAYPGAYFNPRDFEDLYQIKQDGVAITFILDRGEQDGVEPFVRQVVVGVGTNVPRHYCD